MNTPYFSIIIPMYNAEPYIRNILSKIKQQSWRNFECIVINDGSTDNSLHLASEFALNDDRFIVITQQNSGVSAARNKGIQSASGKYLCFVDSDDDINFDHLEKCHALIERTEPDILQFGVHLNNSHGSLLKTIKPRQYELITDFFIFNEICAASLWSKIIRRELFLRHNILLPENIIMNEDLYTSFRLYAYTESIIYSDTIFYKYLQRNDSCTKRRTELHIQSMNKVITLLEEFCIKNKLPNTDKYISYKRFMINTLYITDATLYNIEKWRRNTKYTDIKANRPFLRKSIYLFALLCWNNFDKLAYLICKVQPLFRKLLKY